MASGVKFYQFVEDLAKGVHDFNTDTLKVMLTNTAPVLTNTIKTDITEIAAGNGYAAGGNTAAFTSGAQTTGVYKLVLADPATWTASGGSIGPFRYLVLYNDTPAAPLDPLIGYWDYGSNLTLTAGSTFIQDLDQAAGAITVT